MIEEMIDETPSSGGAFGGVFWLLVLLAVLYFPCSQHIRAKRRRNQVVPTVSNDDDGDDDDELLGESTRTAYEPKPVKRPASPAAAAAIAALKLDGDGKSDASSVRTLDSRPPLDLSKDKVAEKPKPAPPPSEVGAWR